MLGGAVARREADRPAKQWLESASFWVLAVAQAIPIFAFRYFPSEDGPAHLGSARILGAYGGVFQHYFHIDLFPTPNLGTQVVLVALLKLMSPLAAQKALVALLLLAGPWAMRYAILSVNPGAAALTYLGIPLADSWFVHMGYFNFVLGVAFALWSVGWWLRHRNRPSRGSHAVLAVLLTACYLSHLIAWVVALVVIGTVVVWESLSGTPEPQGDTAERTRPPLSRAARTLRPVVAAAAPSVILVVGYMVARSQSGPITWANPVKLAVRILLLDTAVPAYSYREILPSAILSLTIIGLCAYALVRWAPRRLLDRRYAFLAVAAVLALLCFVLPAEIGAAGEVPRRISLMAFVALIIWLAQWPLARRLAAGVVVVSITATAGLLAIRVPKYQAFNVDLKEFASATDVIPPGATVVPLFYVGEMDSYGGSATSRYARPVLQATGYLMAERRIVDLSHYEAGYRYFPTQFRPSLDPFRTIGAGANWLGQIPPHVDILDYPASTGGQGSVDYVIVWGIHFASPAVLADPATTSVQRQLAQGYTLVSKSRRGLVEVFRRR